MKCETCYLANLGSKIAFQGCLMNPTVFGQGVSSERYVASQLQTYEGQDYSISTVVSEVKHMGSIQLMMHTSCGTNRGAHGSHF